MNKHPPFFRIAVEGSSVDGRQIARHHLEQAAASYDPKVYAARIWLEHIRGFYPDSTEGFYRFTLQDRANLT